MKILGVLILLLLQGCFAGEQYQNSPVTSEPEAPAVDSWLLTEADLDEADPTSLISTYKTTEYSLQAGLEDMQTAKAYALLDKNSLSIAGDNVKVAILSTGVDATQSDLDNNIAASGHTADGLTDQTLISEAYAGTGSASVIAAEKAADATMHGVAYNSKITSIRMRGTYSTSDWKQDTIDSGASIIHIGFTETSPSESLIADYKTKFTDIINASVSNLIIVSKGQSTTDNDLGLLADDVGLAGRVIAVATYNKNGVVSGQGDCTGVQDYCLVGTSSYYPDSLAVGYVGAPEHLDVLNASFVSGAATVIKGAWPSLNGAQIVQLLLETATDLGEVGTDSIYGRGKLNLYEAVKAQGSATISYSASALALGYSPASSSLEMSSSFGDALSLNINPIISQTVFFDKYGRDYDASLDQRATSKTTNLLSEKLSTSESDYYSVVNTNKVKFGVISLNQTDLSSKFIAPEQQDALTKETASFSLSQETKDKKGIFSFSFNSTPKSFVEKDSSFDNLNLISPVYFDSSFKNFSSSNADKANINFIHKLTNDLQLGFFASDDNIKEGSQESNNLIAANLGYQFSNKFKFAFEAGHLVEAADQFLNAKSAGAFSTADRTNSQYYHLSANYKLSQNYEAIASYTKGESSINGNEYGIFRAFRNVESRAFALGVVRDNFYKGKLGFIYTEPLRVTSGEVDIDIPVGLDSKGNAVRLQQTASLEPSGKEQNFEIFYDHKVSELTNINFNYLLRKDANHVASAADEAIFLITFKIIK
jgi:hypothetical protein